MMINEDLMHSAEEGEYHILDWRSFKTPCVSRSSLGAEAQAGGQASDAVDFACEKTQDGYELESEEVPANDLGDQLETVNFALCFLCVRHMPCRATPHELSGQASDAECLLLVGDVFIFAA